MIDKIKELNSDQLTTMALVFCFTIFILSVTTCSVHMNMSSPEDVKIASSEAKAQIEISKQEHQESMEQIKAIDKLITETEVDPIAARCAIQGWKGSNTMQSVCMAIVKRTEITKEE